MPLPGGMKSVVPGRNRKARPAHPGHVAHPTAAQVPEHLDSMLGAHGIGVSDDDQSRRRNAPDVLAGPGEGRLVKLLELADEDREAVRIGCDLPVGRLER